MNKIKILVGYHKPAYLLKNEDNIFVPIHLGSKLSGTINKDGMISSSDQKWMLENTVRDDTGDNISDRNHEYCELTGLYWAWKNYNELGNPDIFGFMHYRRQFILSSKYVHDHVPDFCHMIRTDYPDSNYENTIGIDLLSSLTLKNKIIVCSNTLDISPLKYHHSQSFIQQDAYDRSIDILKATFPELSEPLDKYLNGSVHYWSNMFIAERKVFFDLCEWIFPKLDLVYKNIATDHWSIAEKRFIGYLAENLFGVFWETQKLKGVTIESLPLSFIENTDIKSKVYNHNKKEIPIVLSCNQKYAKYAAVTIKSIIENSNDIDQYRIVILENGVNAFTKKKIEFIVSDKPNFHLDFINIKPYTLPYEDLFKSGNAYHYTSDIFNRYFIPEILSEFNKAIYIDCDTILNSDIAELFYTDLEGKPLAAIKDVERRRWLRLPDRKEYVKKYDQNLGIKDSYNYFNSGVLLINIKEWLFCDYFSKIIQFTKAINSNSTHWYGDQDILNGLFYGKVKFLDFDWNVMWVVNNRIRDWTTELDANTVSIYKKSLVTSRLIHYCDQEKPWKLPNFPLASSWWRYARDTPFYEEFLTELLPRTVQNTDIPSTIIKFRTIKNDKDLFQARLTLLRFCVVKNFRRGLKKIHYEDKIRILSEMIRNYEKSKTK